MFARVKLWLARKMWVWSLKLGMDHEAEMEEAIRSLLAAKLVQYGPGFERWLNDVYPRQVTRQGEARSVVTVRSRRV